MITGLLFDLHQLTAAAPGEKAMEPAKTTSGFMLLNILDKDL
jgi:hypothetical protein